MAKRKEIVEVQVQVLLYTDKAVRVKQDGDPVWLPLSQLETPRNEMPTAPGWGSIAMPAHLAEEKELDEKYENPR